MAENRHDDPHGVGRALANYVTELGAQGVFQEQIENPPPGDFPEPVSRDILQAYLPHDLRVDHRLQALKRYVESLAELFPHLDQVLLRTEVITDPDWGEAWKKYFKPLRVSKSLVVKPTWERYTPQARDIVIEMDPGMAFGTGQHASTRMCMAALEGILLRERKTLPWQVLDVGTGTGILGITCAKLGAQRVVCVDSDKKAAEIARENVQLNGVQDRVDVINGDCATITESFDLIVANLTAKLLLKLKSHLLARLNRGGYMVLSGITEPSREDMESSFFRPPLTPCDTVTEKEWICFTLKKN